jgi:tRNA pseudouridine55 synthase
VRKLVACRKVGHAGTLDPLATGVLLVCTGKATKRVAELVHFEKEYVGTIELGKNTNTDDIEGEIIEEYKIPDLTMSKITDVFRKFIGNIEQVPPMFSAIKLNGQRLYQLARKGKTVLRQPRTVCIHELECIQWQSPFLYIRAVTSKGTYIRALARDLGKAFNSGGILTSLRRMRVGPFRVENAYSLDDFKELVTANYL